MCRVRLMLRYMCEFVQFNQLPLHYGMGYGGGRVLMERDRRERWIDGMSIHVEYQWNVYTGGVFLCNIM